MKGDWYVMYNPMAGYIAARVRDITEVVHSGNLELRGEYNAEKEPVKELVDRLNEEEKKSKEN